MKSIQRIFIAILKAIGIIAVTMVAALVMAKIAPPPKGTAFDNLKYMLLPFYVSTFASFIYLGVAFLVIRYEKPTLIIALAIGIIYTVLLFLVA